MPTSPNSRVLVSNQPTVLMSSPYTVSGCPFVSGGANSPCITAQWVVAASRVTSGGQPLVLMNSQALCTPNGTPLNALVTQTRVTAT
jgi:hypothetical protein